MKARHLYIIPALLFVVFAIFQWNDPDPIFWIPVYLYASACTFLALARRLTYLLVVVGFVGYLFLLTYNFPPIEHWTFDHEEGREAMGLIVCGNWVALLGIIKLYNDSYR